MATTRKKSKSTKKKVTLLSGGNPQIAKGDGDAPVKAFIAAMPDWKRGVGERIDKLISKHAPGVKKAVKWNSPFYGMDGKGWFVNFHCFNKYVKVTFFKGSQLEPLPPFAFKDPNVRGLDITEDGKFDEAQFGKWVAQAAKIPGWMA